MAKVELKQPVVAEIAEVLNGAKSAVVVDPDLKVPQGASPQIRPLPHSSPSPGPHSYFPVFLLRLICPTSHFPLSIITHSPLADADGS